jgi:hypothetical protein
MSFFSAAVSLYSSEALPLPPVFPLLPVLPLPPEEALPLLPEAPLGALSREAWVTPVALAICFRAAWVSSFPPARPC